MNIMHGIKYQSGLSLLLRMLGVKHTRLHADKVFSQHPHKYNLFGLSGMLNDYGVETLGLRIGNKEEIKNLIPPFVAQNSHELVLVTKVTDQEISYIWAGKNMTTSLEEFKRTWSGVVLLVEADEKSIEPDYSENRKKELFNTVQKYLLILAVLVLATLLYIHQKMYTDIGMTASLIVNIIGIYTGYLLVLKQMHIKGSYGDKICSLLKKSDCNDILESQAAKIGGVMGWIEIGLGYFISNTLITLTAPRHIAYLAIISACALGYSVWSIWYQKFKAKAWCPLCLIVQGIFIMLFAIYLAAGLFSIPSFALLDILFLGAIYLLPVFSINLFLPLLAEGRKAEQITYEMNSLKMKDDVFGAILRQQPFYEINKSTSKILFGNPNAQILISILTNPHCNPCALMHKRIGNLLERNNTDFCIQYIFSSFNEELETSGKCLINAYFTHQREKSDEIFGEWFEYGKYSQEAFFEKYALDASDTDAVAEYAAHQFWKENTGLRATPTVLINGYKLPHEYKIEDMLYFSNREVYSK
ncbi:MAG: vitamin K epoxide reductase family protein [Dysgonamonadaceae bacterium]